MSTKKLIYKCLRYADNHGINYKVCSFPTKDDPSMVLINQRFMFINRNVSHYSQLPFYICHEISHVLNHDDLEKISFKIELNADYKALNILRKLIKKIVNLINGLTNNETIL